MLNNALDSKVNPDHSQCRNDNYFSRNSHLNITPRKPF